MPIYTMPRRPEPLPVAPKAVDAPLLRRLVASRSELHGLVVVLVPRCQFLQCSIGSGRWYSRKDLSITQRLCRTALKAARAHRDLSPETLAALDRMHGFCEAQDVTNAREVAA